MPQSNPSYVNGQPMLVVVASVLRTLHSSAPHPGLRKPGSVRVRGVGALDRCRGKVGGVGAVDMMYSGASCGLIWFFEPNTHLSYLSVVLTPICLPLNLLQHQLLVVVLCICLS